MDSKTLFWFLIWFLIYMFEFLKSYLIPKEFIGEQNINIYGFLDSINDEIKLVAASQANQTYIFRFRWSFKKKMTETPRLYFDEILSKKILMVSPEIWHKELTINEEYADFEIGIRYLQNTLVKKNLFENHFEDFKIVASLNLFEENDWRFKVLQFFSKDLPNSKFGFLC